MSFTMHANSSLIPMIALWDFFFQTLTELFVGWTKHLPISIVPIIRCMYSSIFFYKKYGSIIWSLDKGQRKYQYYHAHYTTYYLLDTARHGASRGRNPESAKAPAGVDRNSGRPRRRMRVVSSTRPVAIISA